MAEITPFALSKLYGQLLGQDVRVVSKLRPAPTRPKLIYGVYQQAADGQPMVVKADFALMGSLGGALVGLPDGSVAEQIKEGDLGESLRDSMHEIFNISSTPLSVEGRVVFKTMHTNVNTLPQPARQIVAQPGRTVSFEIAVPGYTGGALDVLMA